MNNPPEGQTPNPCKLNEELSDQLASLYVLKALEPREHDEFEEHIDAGCESCNKKVRSLLEFQASEVFQAKNLQLPPRVQDRLKSQLSEKLSPTGPAQTSEEIQLFKSWNSSLRPADGFYILRSAEGEWESAGEGVQFKKLSVDPDRRYVTMLVKMEKGSSYPSHHHSGREECFVLSGDLKVGDEVLGPGDFQFADEGSDHGVQSTENGCMLLIVSSQDDELI